MALSAVSVDNFRAFGRRGRLEIRPLTLVFGYNSRGKSALVRALPLLADSTRRGAGGPLDTRSEAARGATFGELKSGYGLSPTVDFGLEWDDDTNQVVRVEVRILGGGFQAIEWVERIEAYDRGGARLLQILLKDEEAELYEVITTAGETFEATFAFEGLTPTSMGTEGGAEPPSAAVVLLRHLQQRLGRLAEDIHWLSAVRAVPPRRGEMRGRPPRIGFDGSGAAEQLAYAQARERAVVDEVSAFYRKATGHDLHVEEVQIGSVPGFTVSLSSLEGPAFRVNLIDTGEGMAQVLPVAVLCALAKQGHLGPHPVVVLEHPELHLHPRAHEEVAWFLVQVAASSDARIIVETHSENLLSRVQLAVLRGEIDPKHVIVHWVWQHEAGASVQPMELDAEARFLPDKWPPGVFSEDTRLAREILTERRKTSTQAKKLHGACRLRIPHHMLERRSIENYVTRPALEAWGEKKGIQERVGAFHAMPIQHQRSFFNMKHGLNKDEKSEEGVAEDLTARTCWIPRCGRNSTTASAPPCATCSGMGSSAHPT